MAGGPGKEREVGMVETFSLLITAVKTAVNRAKTTLLIGGNLMVTLSLD